MSQVKNLRAMFEQNKGETSPPDRGRASGASTPILGTSTIPEEVLVIFPPSLLADRIKLLGMEERSFGILQLGWLAVFAQGELLGGVGVLSAAILSRHVSFLLPC